MWLSARQGERVTEAGIAETADLPEPELSEAVSYLSDDLGILQRQRAYPKAPTGVFCFTDSETFLEISQRHFKNYPLRSSAVRLADSDSRFHAPCSVNGRLLVADFSLDYNAGRVRSLYNAFADHAATIFLTAYFLGDTAYFDNIHSPSWGTPCHYCNVGLLQKGFHSQKTGQSDSWSFLYDFIMENGLTLPPRVALSSLDIYSVGAIFLKKIDSLLLSNEPKLPPDDHKLVTSISCRTGIPARDISLHWTFCECSNQ